MTISGATGSYTDAPETRAYSIVYHGLSTAPTLYFSGTAIKSYQSLSGIPGNETGLVWNSGKKLATVVLPKQDIKDAFIVSSDQNATRLHGKNSDFFKKPAVTLRSGILTIHSSFNDGPISVTLFSLNGRTLKKTVVIKPERFHNGHTYTYHYPECSPGLCIVDITNNDMHFSQKVFIR